MATANSSGTNPPSVNSTPPAPDPSPTPDDLDSTAARSDDPAWKHGKVVVGKKNHTICLYCNKHIKGGGITRLKYHLAEKGGDVDRCPKASFDVRHEMGALIEEKKNAKQRKQMVFEDVGQGAGVNESHMEGSFSPTSSIGVSNSVLEGNKKRRNSNPSPVAPRTTPGSQPSIRSVLASKQMVDNAKIALARWWYDANISFNAANSPYYQPAIDAMVAIGPGFKGPSYYELRGPLLNNHCVEIREYLVGIKRMWADEGCTIMADGWTDRCQVPIIIFLAYCSKGIVFIKSVNTIGLVKDADTLFNLFDDVVKLVGPGNIVQFTTDNEAAYKAAGKCLASHYGTFYWTPCAAHCLDLMLENFAKKEHFPFIWNTIETAKSVSRYIYNHPTVLNLMRNEFTNGGNLRRPGITRFANFLSLQSFLKYKNELRQMFTSTKWVGSRYGKSVRGKEIEKIVLEDSEFWQMCSLVVMISEPLVKVLRMVDGDEKPSMGYLYEAMNRAKESIMARLKHRIHLYLPYIRVIDARWDKQLHSPLHAAGCFLNPSIYFRPSFKKQKEVLRGLMVAIQSLISDEDLQELVSTQVEEYRQAVGDFGMSLAIRLRNRSSPVQWWHQFGNGCPDLQSFAIRILSQCCSSSGCERNWSMFEFIQSKRRNNLEHKRLNDLVFVRYNLKLRERNIRQTKAAIDPISFDSIDVLGEWVWEEPPLLEGEKLEEDLGWEAIDEPFGALRLDDDELDVDEIAVNVELPSVLASTNVYGGTQDPYEYVEE